MISATTMIFLLFSVLIPLSPIIYSFVKINNTDFFTFSLINTCLYLATIQSKNKQICKMRECSN